MNIGQKLSDLRKEKHLSQEEVADKLNVTRQTVSKWETNQSTPDFDKIGPLCELYGISADELLKLDVPKKESGENYSSENNIKKKALGIGLGVLLYFIAIAFVAVTIPVLRMNPIVASAIFLIICGVATFIIIYVCLIYKKEKVESKEEKENKIVKEINEILSIFVTIIYLIISFVTMAWHITWIIWIVYALISEIVKLLFMLRGTNNEE